LLGLEQVVPGVGCAQGSWGSKGSDPKTEGVQSALASVGSKAYADYMVDAMTNTWTGNLGIDGYTEDVSCNYGCMLQLTDPEKGSLPDWANIVKRVRATHPQLVMSGEGYGSWAEMVIADANLGGQGSNDYHIAFQKAVTDGDASQLETIASTSGADAASVLCYLNPAYDGLQPGGCPTMCTGLDPNPWSCQTLHVFRAWRLAHSLRDCVALSPAQTSATAPARWPTSSSTRSGWRSRRGRGSSLSTTMIRRPPAPASAAATSGATGRASRARAASVGRGGT